MHPASTEQGYKFVPGGGILRPARNDDVFDPPAFKTPTHDFHPEVTQVGA